MVARLFFSLAIATVLTGCSQVPNLDPASDMTLVSRAVRLPAPGQKLDLSKVLIKGKTNIIYLHADW